MIQGLEFGLGFRVQSLGLGFRVQSLGLGFKVQGLSFEFRVQNLRLRVYGLASGVIVVKIGVIRFQLFLNKFNIV